MRISDWSSDVCSSERISRSSANAGRSMTAAVSDDPFALFDSWPADARAGEPNAANALALATTPPDGRPSLRMVLLKGHGPDGFIFYTNLDSRAGGDHAANPHAQLLFPWKSLLRHLRHAAPVTTVHAATPAR